MMNEEKQIAQAIMDAQKMQEESFDGEEYTKDITDCLLETCKKYELTDNLWALLNLAMHWMNDIQCWADDIMAGKNILDECNREPMNDDDVIELTKKDKAHGEARKFANEFHESKLIDPEMEIDLHIPICDTTLKLTPNGQLEEKPHLCDTCEEIFSECKGCPTWLPTDDNSRHIIECDCYKKQDRIVNLCDTCKHSSGECKSILKYTEDNVVKCNYYKKLISLCDTCESIAADCHNERETIGNTNHVIKCASYKKQDRMVNLCDTCISDFQDCGAVGMEFGDGLGHDNVIVCFTYTIKD